MNYQRLAADIEYDNNAMMAVPKWHHIRMYLKNSNHFLNYVQTSNFGNILFHILWVPSPQH